jgi:hypothetical protein
LEETMETKKRKGDACTTVTTSLDGSICARSGPKQQFPSARFGDGCLPADPAEIRLSKYDTARDGVVPRLCKKVVLYRGEGNFHIVAYDS